MSEVWEGVLTVGSLFAGIGGFDLGLERAGMRSVWQSEIDPYCQRVLAKHWPDVLRVPDVRDVNADTVPAVDVICGGFPCQDLSYAGKGAGLDGARSGLWSEYARVVHELGPRYVVVENVSALLARGLGTVLRDLAAIGYDAEWDCIPASAVGAPHRRDRIWLVAYPMGDSDGQRLEGRRIGGGPVDADDGGCGISASPSRGASVADPGSERLNRRRHGPASPQAAGAYGPTDRRGVGWSAEGWWSVEPNVGRVAHGVPARVDRLRALGNALVPQIAEWIGRRIIDYEGERADAA